MNTSDSVDIVNFFAEQFRNHPSYIANLLVLINKCDEMEYNEGKLRIKAKQLKEMESQIKETIEEKLSGIKNLNVKFLLLSSK